MIHTKFMYYFYSILFTNFVVPPKAAVVEKPPSPVKEHGKLRLSFSAIPNKNIGNCRNCQS